MVRTGRGHREKLCETVPHVPLGHPETMKRPVGWDQSLRLYSQSSVLASQSPQSSVLAPVPGGLAPCSESPSRLGHPYVHDLPKRDIQVQI